MHSRRREKNKGEENAMQRREAKVMTLVILPQSLTLYHFAHNRLEISVRLPAIQTADMGGLWSGTTTRLCLRSPTIISRLNCTPNAELAIAKENAFHPTDTRTYISRQKYACRSLGSGLTPHSKAETIELNALLRLTDPVAILFPVRSSTATIQSLRMLAQRCV